MISIRNANRTDIDRICELLKQFADESPVPELKYFQNEKYVRSMVGSILLGHGILLVSCNESTVTGLLMAIRQGSIWNPDIKIMSEMAWFVGQEYRHGRSGYKLIKEYIKCCNDEISQQKIKTFTITKMVSSPDIDYVRLGFNKLEEDFIWQAH